MYPSRNKNSKNPTKIYQKEVNYRSRIDGRQPLKEDKLLMEDDLLWKMTLDGRLEDDLGWKMTLDGRRLWTKCNLELKRTLLEDGIGWKTTLDGRQP